ncbi:MAG: hypothetical protein J5562_05670 [Clostridia bacterium]|nr:hypothetical protein [Clostridia bacterium]
MAKLNYTKPAFAFHQIPLVTGGGTGCSYNWEANDQNCTVTDPDLGMSIFTQGNGYCEIAGDPSDFCYTVPMADHNIYNS